MKDNINSNNNNNITKICNNFMSCIYFQHPFIEINKKPNNSYSR